uniref:Uncharacterized protein n=1 Tax=Amphimedon queenslandica TaxID=400682 RepID=A0A1X7VSK3_AMPQE
MPKKTGHEFIWTDDEVELLLNVVSDYKSKKATESADWESVKSKYSDIHRELLAVLPEENNTSQKDFLHKKEHVTKQIVTSKLQAVTTKYRQAVDSGRRSGHGRVVLIFYEQCEKVWGGSPATEQIEGSCETTDLVNSEYTGQQQNNDCDRLNNIQPSSRHQIDHHGNTDRSPTEAENEDESEDYNDSSPARQTTSSSTQDCTRESGEGEAVIHQQQRKLLDGKLDNYRNEKLKRKLPSKQKHETGTNLYRLNRFRCCVNVGKLAKQTKVNNDDSIAMSVAVRDKLK